MTPRRLDVRRRSLLCDPDEYYDSVVSRCGLCRDICGPHFFTFCARNCPEYYRNHVVRRPQVVDTSGEQSAAVWSVFSLSIAYSTSLMPAPTDEPSVQPYAASASIYDQLITKPLFWISVVSVFIALITTVAVIVLCVVRGRKPSPSTGRGRYYLAVPTTGLPVDDVTAANHGKGHHHDNDDDPSRRNGSRGSTRSFDSDKQSADNSSSKADATAEFSPLRSVGYTSNVTQQLQSDKYKLSGDCISLRSSVDPFPDIQQQSPSDVRCPRPPASAVFVTAPQKQQRKRSHDDTSSLTTVRNPSNTRTAAGSNSTSRHVDNRQQWAEPSRPPVCGDETPLKVHGVVDGCHTSAYSPVKHRYFFNAQTITVAGAESWRPTRHLVKLTYELNNCRTTRHSSVSSSISSEDTDHREQEVEEEEEEGYYTGHTLHVTPTLTYKSVEYTNDTVKHIGHRVSS